MTPFGKKTVGNVTVFLIIIITIISNIVGGLLAIKANLQHHLTTTGPLLIWPLQYINLFHNNLTPSMGKGKENIIINA